MCNSGYFLHGWLGYVIHFSVIHLCWNSNECICQKCVLIWRNPWDSEIIGEVSWVAHLCILNLWLYPLNITYVLQWSNRFIQTKGLFILTIWQAYKWDLACYENNMKSCIVFIWDKRFPFYFNLFRVILFYFILFCFIKFHYIRRVTTTACAN